MGSARDATRESQDDDDFSSEVIFEMRGNCDLLIYETVVKLFARQDNEHVKL